MSDFKLRATHTALTPVTEPALPHLVSKLLAYAVRDTAAWQDESKASNKETQLAQHLAAVLMGTGYSLRSVDIRGDIRGNVVALELVQILGMQVEVPE